MRRHRQRRDIGDDAAEHPPDRRRVPIADRVGEDNAVGAGCGDLIGDAPHPVLVDIALDRAAEARGETAIDPRPVGAAPFAAQFDDAPEIGDRLLGAAPDIREVMAVADRQHEIHLVHPESKAALGAA